MGVEQREAATPPASTSDHPEGGATGGGNAGGQDVPQSHDADGEAADAERLRVTERLVALFLPALVLGSILAVLIPAIVVAEASGVVLLKLAAAGLLSYLPGWLYLQFIKNKGQSLYDEYVLNLFRLHIDEYRNLPAPPQHTSYYKLWQRHHAELGAATRDNLYRKKFESIYGKSAVSTFDLIYRRRTIRAHTETFAPVLFATLLLCLGWVLVLQPEPWRELNLFGALDPTGRPDLPSDVLRFGFLGAYAFIVQDLLRRYFRDDLKTGAYISAVARLVFVAVVLTAVQLVAPFESRGFQQAFGFMVGFFPQVGLQALQAALAKPLGALIPTVRVQHPLSELDGLNIWYEARLVEEGIEDMQNLVSANLVDLILRSRAPVARLVDWIDQAFLALHLPTARDVGDDKRADAPRALLRRRLGIRTATDLQRAYATLRDDRGFRAALSGALQVPEEEAVATVRSILAALEGDANFWHVGEFKRHEWLLADSRRELQTAGRTVATNGETASDSAPGPAAEVALASPRPSGETEIDLRTQEEPITTAPTGSP